MKGFLIILSVLFLSSIIHGNRPDNLLTSKLFGLYSSRDSEGNFMFSPWSLSMGLGMLYQGLGDSSRKDLETQLGFGKPLELKALATAGESPVLSSGNLIIMDNSTTPKKAFVNNVKSIFKASPFIQNFGSVKIPKLVAKVNKWVKDKTSGIIDKFLPSDGLDHLTKILLINALSFEDEWFGKFDESLTEDGDFTLSSGEKVQVPMMSGDFYDIPISTENDEIILSLPFATDPNIFITFIQTEQTEKLFKDLETRTGFGNVIFNINSTLPKKAVTMNLPKYQFSTKKEMIADLMSLGIKDAFQEGADFSRITKNHRNLKVDSIHHKSVVDVNENGVKASAATGISVTLYSLFVPDVRVTFNKPFYFFITHQDAETILFAGRVENPLE